MTHPLARTSPLWRLPAAALTMARQPKDDLAAMKLPDTTAHMTEAVINPRHLRKFRQLTGHSPEDTALPVPYLHILGFGLAMRILTSRGFPFSVTGLLHIGNDITQYRTLSVTDRPSLRVWAADLRSHRAGVAFDVVTTAELDGETVWWENSTYLHRVPIQRQDKQAEEKPEPEPLDEHIAQWDVDGRTGLRYARISGDFNPIHLSRLSAKAFGLSRHIVHGMWTLARTLGDLETRLPDAPSVVSAQFHKPLLLPAHQVALRATPRADGLRFAVRSADGQREYLSASATSSASGTAL